NHRSLPASHALSCGQSMTPSRPSLLFRWTACLLAFGLAALCAIPNLPREPWYALPSGGEIQLRTVAYTETLELTSFGFRLDDLRDWLGPTWSQLLGPYPEFSSTGFGAPVLVAAFTVRGRKDNSNLRNVHCEIDLPGGQTLLANFTGSGGTLEKATYL